MSVDKYLNVITSEHRQQPNYTAMLSVLLRPADDVQNLLDLWTYIFDLESAEGDALDKLGERVGCLRSLDLYPESQAMVRLEDDYYRVCIKVKILNNQWDGTIESLLKNFDTMFPDYILTVVDNQDMTMKLIIEGISDKLMQRLMMVGHLLPKPAGVRLEIVIRILREDDLNLYTGIAMKTTKNREGEVPEWYADTLTLLVENDGEVSEETITMPEGLLLFTMQEYGVIAGTPEDIAAVAITDGVIEIEEEVE
jgi:hypothetical protein